MLGSFVSGLVVLKASIDTGSEVSELSPTILKTWQMKVSELPAQELSAVVVELLLPPPPPQLTKAKVLTASSMVVDHFSVVFMIDSYQLVIYKFIWHQVLEWLGTEILLDNQ